MPTYYALVKRKGAKNWIGALPSKYGIHKERFKKYVRTKIKKGFCYKIINSSQLKKILTNIVRKFKINKIKKPIKRRKKVSKKKITRRKSSKGIKFSKYKPKRKKR